MRGRLYLDLSDLFTIGDGDAEAGSLTGLLDAMAETKTALVVSREHVQDASRGDVSSLESLVAAVDVFPLVLAVMDGPETVEPLADARHDIVLQACSNFRELVFSEAATKRLATLNNVYNRIHEGSTNAKKTLASKDARQIRSRNARRLFNQALITLCHGWMGDDTELILSLWERNLSIAATETERRAILGDLEAAKAALAPIVAAAGASNIDVIDGLRSHIAWETEPSRWPGHFLGYRIHIARQRDRMRTPRRSDWLDVEHAMHFPYVDFATCDANTLDAVRRVLPTMACPRQPVIVQSGHLEQVAREIHAQAKTRIR